MSPGFDNLQQVGPAVGPSFRGSFFMDRELSKVAVNITLPSHTLDGINLDAKAYDEVLTNATTARMFPGGTTMPEYLRQLTASESWRQLDGTADHGVMARSQYVQSVIDAAYSYGKEKFTQDHPEFHAAMIQKLMDRASNYSVPQQQAQ
jgi:hypothetical protein